MSAIFELSDRAVELFADANPVYATFMGVPGRDARWPDLSPEGHAAERAMWAGIVADAEALTPADDAEDLARRVLLAEATDAIERFDAGEHLRDLNNIASSFQSIKDCLDHMDRSELDGWANTMIRLETMQYPLEGYRATLQAGLDAGAPVARRQVLAAIDEGRVAAGPDSSFRSLIAALAESGLGDDGTRDRLAAAVENGCRAYGEMADWLETEYLPHAVERDGCGRDRYVLEARKHLGMTIDIDQTYAWGWAEIDRLIECSPSTDRRAFGKRADIERAYVEWLAAK